MPRHNGLVPTATATDNLPRTAPTGTTAEDVCPPPATRKLSEELVKQKWDDLPID